MPGKFYPRSSLDFILFEISAKSLVTFSEKAFPSVLDNAAMVLPSFIFKILTTCTSVPWNFKSFFKSDNLCLSKCNDA